MCMCVIKLRQMCVCVITHMYEYQTKMILIVESKYLVPKHDVLCLHLEVVLRNKSAHMPTWSRGRTKKVKHAKNVIECSVLAPPLEILFLQIIIS